MKNGIKFLDKLEKFKKAGANLFDLALCKCGIICKCDKKHRVPNDMQTFLADQRGARILQIPRRLIDIEISEYTALAEKSLCI